MAHSSRARRIPTQRTSSDSNSFFQIRDKVDVLITATGQIQDDRVILGQFASNLSGRQNCMRCFERWNDSLQFGAKLEAFGRFGVTRSNVVSSSVVVQKRVLRPDRRI